MDVVTWCEEWEGRPADRPPLYVVPTPPPRRRNVYLRRRLVALLVAGLVVVLAGRAVAAVAPLAAAVVDGGPAVAPVAPASPSSAGEHVVRPGDTYWSIATSLGGEGDPRAVVDALVAANGGRVLQVGDRLVLPG